MNLKFLRFDHALLTLFYCCTSISRTLLQEEESMYEPSSLGGFITLSSLGFTAVPPSPGSPSGGGE